MQEVEHLIDFPSTKFDPDVVDYVLSFRRSIYQRRLDKVNDLFPKFHDVWATGRPIDFFVALEACDDSVSRCLASVKYQKFRRAVVQEVRQRGFPNVYEPDAPKDDWSEADLEEFTAVYRRLGKDLSAISRVLGKSRNECVTIYRLLRKQLPPVQCDPDKFAKEFILDLTFTHEGEEYRVEGSNELLRQNKERNPVPDLKDAETQQVMDFPTRGPDGRILDYFTWLKLANQGQDIPLDKLERL